MAVPDKKYMKPELICQEPRLNPRAKLITAISTDHRKTNDEVRLRNATRGLSVEAAGIAPASHATQVHRRKSLAKHAPLGLSELCRDDAALPEIVANWHRLTPEVRAAMLESVRSV